MARWSRDTIVPIKRDIVSFGNQIRSYVQGRGVKDLRTGIEGDFDRVLDGDLDRFLRAGLAWPGRRPRKRNAPVAE